MVRTQETMITKSETWSTSCPGTRSRILSTPGTQKNQVVRHSGNNFVHSQKAKLVPGAHAGTHSRNSFVHSRNTKRAWYALRKPFCPLPDHKKRNLIAL